MMKSLNISLDDRQWKVLLRHRDFHPANSWREWLLNLVEKDANES